MTLPSKPWKDVGEHHMILGREAMPCIIMFLNNRHYFCNHFHIKIQKIYDKCHDKKSCCCNHNTAQNPKNHLNEMSIEAFSALSLKAKNVIPITAQCTVFAESEVVSWINFQLYYMKFQHFFNCPFQTFILGTTSRNADY